MTTEPAATPVAAILAGGNVAISDRLRAAVAEASLVIAADGGMALADRLGLEPGLWVGDFDSSDEALVLAHPDVPRQEHPADKDELDLELAIAAALDRGARSLVLVGVLDGRLDQTLAALLIAGRFREEGTAMRLFGHDHETHLLTAGDERAFELPPGTVFSLLSLRGDAVVDVRGARFPLDNARLPFGTGFGVSNRADGGPSVAVRAGTLALVIEWGVDGAA